MAESAAGSSGVQSESSSDFEERTFDDVKVGDIIFSRIEKPYKLLKTFAVPIKRTRYSNSNGYIFEQIVVDKNPTTGLLTTVLIVGVGDLHFPIDGAGSNEGDEDLWTLYDNGKDRKSQKKDKPYIRPTESQWASELNLLIPIEPNTVVRRGEKRQSNFVVKYDSTSQASLPGSWKRWVCVRRTFDVAPRSSGTFRVYRDMPIDQANARELLRRAREYEETTDITHVSSSSHHHGHHRGGRGSSGTGH